MSSRQHIINEFSGNYTTKGTLNVGNTYNAKVQNFINDQSADILAWISPIKHENRHKDRSPLAHTGEWLLSHPNYLAWRKSSVSSTFWLNGFMGSGKSVLAHVVIEDIQKCEKVAFFYCNADASDPTQKSDARNIIRCLLKQTVDARQDGKLMKSIKDAHEAMSGKADLTIGEAADLLTLAVSQYPKTTFVIDGLDECPPSTQIEVLETLYRIIGRSERLVYLFVSSRRTRELIDMLEEDAIQTDTASNNKEDIDCLVVSRVEEAANSRGLKALYQHGINSLKCVVIEELKRGANGMFRWVELALQYVHGSKHPRGLKDRLGRLSRLESLFDLYDLHYKQLDEIEEQDRVAVKTAFYFLIYGQKLSNYSKKSHRRQNDRWSDSKFEDEALSRFDVGPLIDGVNFAASGELEDEPYYNAKLIAILAPAFLLSDGESLSFPHFSAKEYLLNRHTSEYGDRKGHSHLAELSMRLFTSVEEEVIMKSQSQFVVYSAINWINHLLFRKLIEKEDSTLVQFLTNEPTLRLIIETFLLESDAPAGFLRASTIIENSSMLKNQHWKWDEVATYLPTSPPSSAFARILLDHKWDDPEFMEKHLVVRAAESRETPRKEWHVCNPSILHFAIWTGNIQAVDRLLGLGFDINEEDWRGHNGLRYLMGFPSDPQLLLNLLHRQNYRPEAFAKDLLARGINARHMDNMGRGPLYWNFRDCPEVVQRLLINLLVRHGNSPLEVDKFGYTPLDLALNGEGDSVIQCLVEEADFGENGADINMRDKDGLTILNRAAKRCNEATIRLLVKKGADTQLRSTESKTAFQYAVEKTNMSILPCFIELSEIDSVDMNSQHENGYAPIHLIAAHCSESLVRLCIEKGGDTCARSNLHGLTPWGWAEMFDNKLVMQYLSSLPIGN